MGGGTGGGCSTRVPTGPVVFINAGDSVTNAMAGKAAGTTYVFDGGVHRLSQPIVPRANDTFFGTVSADCRNLTTLRGSVGFGPGAMALVNGLYRSPLPYARQTSLDLGVPTTTDVCPGSGGPACENGRHCLLYNDLHAAWADGGRFRFEPQVDAGIGIDGGSFRFVDLGNGTAYVEVEGPPPANSTWELSTTSHAFRGNAPGVTVADLVVEFFASPQQEGAIGEVGDGQGWRVEDVEARYNHAAGIHLGDGGVMARNYVHHNGQIGVRVTDARDASVVANEVSNNNVAGYCAQWEGGGSKFARTVGLLVSGNCVHHNAGQGLWTDIRNYATRYESNVAFNNTGGGIFHEVSGDAKMLGNVVAFNGGPKANPGSSHGAQILVSLSEGVEIANNKVLTAPNDGHGIVFTWDSRAKPTFCCPPMPAACSVLCALGNGSVHHNDVVLENSWGRQGMVFIDPNVDAGATAHAFSTTSFNNNRYFFADAGSQAFAWWDGGAVWARSTFPQFKSTGQEAAGTLKLRTDVSAPDVAALAVCPPRSRK